MKFFTSDLHFGSEDIMEREARPFRDIGEFEEVFVNNVNCAATKADTLYVIGDWIDYSSACHPDPEEVFSISLRILPSIVLIIGNDERRLMYVRYNGSLDEMRSCLMGYGISDVKASEYTEFGGEKFYLTHQPRDHKEGYVNLFGHTHRATGLWKPYGLNVGVDLNYFRPFSETEILRLLEQKRLWWDNDPDTHDM